MALTDDGKNTYYHNKTTDETTWVQPHDYTPPADAEPSGPRQIQIDGTEWQGLTVPSFRILPSFFSTATLTACT